MKTVVGLFDSWSQAQGAINELIASGCQRDAINLMASDDERQRWMGEEQGQFEEGTGRGIGKYSFLSGGFSSLVTLGVEEQDAQLYAEGVNRGGFLVAVSTDDLNAQRIAGILNRYGAIDIDQRRSLRGAGIAQGVGTESLQQSGVQDTRGQRPIDVVEETREEYRDRPFSSRENAETPLASQQPYVKEEVTVTGQSTGREEVVTEAAQRSDVEVEKSQSRQAQRDFSSQEVSGQDLSRQGIAPQDISQQDVSRQSISSQHISREDISSQDVSGKDISRQDVSGQNVSSQDVYERDISSQNVSGQDISRQDVSTMDDDEFMRHFTSTYGQRGERFDEPYRSAYHFAESESVSHPQLRDKEWFEVEEEVHRDWELSHPGTWVKVQDAIHFGWDRNLRHH